MKVLKFGGTSLGNWQRFEQASEIIIKAAEKEKIAAVLSAPATVTNTLIEMMDTAAKGESYKEVIERLLTLFKKLFDDSESLIGKERKAKLEEILKNRAEYWDVTSKCIAYMKGYEDSFCADVSVCGERLSCALMEQVLQAKGKKAEIFDSIKAFEAKGPALNAVVNIESSKKNFAKCDFSNIDIAVMPGFGATSHDNKAVTLGRNGSDYSAACVAACLSADCCEIWTDVDGAFNADPRIVSDAHLLSQLTYREAMEMSYFGAKVLHPKTITPLATYHIPCYIKNTFKPDFEGTLISDEPDKSGLIVKSISLLEKQTMVNVSGPGMKGLVGMASRVFAAISRAEVSVSLITQSSSEYSICFCIAAADSEKVKDALTDEFELELQSGFLEPIDFKNDLSIISIVGDNMKTRKGLSARFFKALAQAGVNVVAIAQGSSERSISVVIDKMSATRAVVNTHQAFFDVQQYIEVMLVGSGNIGSALLNQIKKQKEFLKERNITLKVCGIANSKKMILDEKGIDLDNWKEVLGKDSVDVDMSKMFAWVNEHQLINPVLVDCTSNQDVANCYVEAMNEGLHVVTPNKKANTRDLGYYSDLRTTALKQRRQFLYETNVGAGLPVIDNLKKLIFAGDKLIKFKGILSGSLSFIFGKLDEGMSLSEATKIAREKGFTEPDPRDDLSGMDVARKVLILAREVGFKYELSDISVESVLPKELDFTGTKEEFMEKLPTADKILAERVEKAKSKGKRLRYVGEIDGNKCSVKIAEVDSDDPLYAVKNGENALAFYSEYYTPIPFVLRGYGAGNEVTAAGVFADILRTLNWTRDEII